LAPSKSPLDVVYLASNLTNNVNRAGARALMEEIAPAVEAAMPGRYRFHVVARDARQVLGDRETPGSRLHDWVEDLSRFMEDMDIACLPVRIGWGCKIKMIESLAWGLPTLGSPQSFRGVPHRSDAYMVCRDTDAFVDAFRALLDDTRRLELGRQGRAAYESWLEQGTSILERELDEVLPAPRTSAPAR
jgi:glycosyltransferase involved in cell wall biosynthesis